MGEINGNIGEMNFPDDFDEEGKVYTFEYVPQERTVYWNGLESGLKWIKHTAIRAYKQRTKGCLTCHNKK